FLLRFFGGLFLCDIGLYLLFDLLGFLGLLRPGSLLGSGCFLRIRPSSLLGLPLFRSLGRCLLLLLDLALFHLLGLVLLGGSLLGFASDLLISLGRGLTLRLQLIQRGL